MRSTFACLALLVLAIPLAAQSYCVPTSIGFNCGVGDEFIQNITITDPVGAVILNNTSTCGVGVAGYEDYTASVAPVLLVPGTPYTITVTVGQWWGTDFVNIWLDLNQNFSFEDAGEMVLTMTSASGGGGAAPLTLTGTLNVPMAILPGVARMRARLFYNVAPIPASCGTNTFGNCEDYATFVGGVVVPEYQVNNPGASMDFNGVLGGAFSPATLALCSGGTVNACINSGGLPSDVAYNVSPLIPVSTGGIMVTPNHIVNLNIAGGLFWLFNNWFPTGPAYGSCPLAFGAPPVTISAQLVSIDPTSAIGASFSQGCQVTGIVGGAQTLVNADDASYTIDVTAAPICHAPVAYYGTSYTQISVSTNGVICPGAAGVTGWTPSAALAITNPGSFGIWSDWQSNLGATASIVVNGGGLYGGVDVTYTNVPYWGTPITSTFNVGLDALGPRIEGITGLGTDPTTPTMIVVSQGGGVATDPGATVFGLNAVGTATLVATDMLYAIGTGGSPALGGGANNLWFTSTPGGTIWQGF